MASNKRLLVAAIDFGTTYSGWAFSFKYEYESEPTKINGMQHIGGQLVSLKVPMAVLIKSDGETFDSFGYEAEDKYAELADAGEHENWYYFSRFKMVLYENIWGITSKHGKKGNKQMSALIPEVHVSQQHDNVKITTSLTTDMELEDETHKRLSAVKVFSLAIRCLKDDMLKVSRDRLTTDQLRDDEILWVLTVPAIWSEPAKNFMKEAAVEAGINVENLKIALEPETASIFCCLLPVEQFVERLEIVCFQIGSKYMVLDAGGGTVDITVHEVISGGKVKELQKASGGAWGGTQVDEAFKQFIISLVGNSVFQRFVRESKEDQLEILRDFELKKRTIVSNKNTKIKFRMPAALPKIFLEETGKKLCDAIKQTKYAKEVTLKDDKLIVNASVMKGFFSRIIDSIISHVQELLKDKQVQEISSILMVGGFSECEMLQHAIRSSFPNISIVVPRDAGLVVLKGAVIFGHNPSSIVQRVCKYTYGIRAYVSFDEKIHDIKKREEFEDGPYCAEVFFKHIEMGQIVALDQSTEPRSYLPMTEDQTSIGFNIYASTKTKSPLYVTDDGCVKLGYVSVGIRDMSVPLNERGVLVTMSFGGTEIEVTAKEKRTGNCNGSRQIPWVDYRIVI